MTPYITERNSIGIWQNKQLCHDTPPFVTIEGQLLSVRTVINMLHFLNQLIVYTIWKLAFSELTKITPLTCSPFYQYTECMSRRDLSVKGGTSERCYRTRRGRTDEQRYAILSPYFDGRIKMNGPYPEITIYHFWPNYFSKLSSVWLRRGCLFAWRTDGRT